MLEELNFALLIPTECKRLRLAFFMTDMRESINNILVFVQAKVQPIVSRIKVRACNYLGTTT